MTIHKYLVRLRQAVSTVIVFTIFETSTAAFAASGQPSENSSWTLEPLPGQNLLTPASLCEATSQDGTLIRVWRGNTNNEVWMAYGGGAPFTLGETTTFYAPVVVPYAANQFMIFHTGRDRHIYYTLVTAGSTTQWLGTWRQISHNQTALGPVTAATYNINNGNVFVGYRGSGIDDQIYGTWFGEQITGNVDWSPSQVVAGGRGILGPSVTYNAANNCLYMVVAGEDANIWFTFQPVGQADWAAWQSLGQTTGNAPQIAANANGNLMVSGINSDSVPIYREFTSQMNGGTNWTTDVTGWQTFNPVTFRVVANQVYALLVGLGNTAYYKQVTNF